MLAEQVRLQIDQRTIKPARDRYEIALHRVEVDAR
jgi:hypothetical protein